MTDTGRVTSKVIRGAWLGLMAVGLSGILGLVATCRRDAPPLTPVPTATQREAAARVLTSIGQRAVIDQAQDAVRSRLAQPHLAEFYSVGLYEHSGRLQVCGTVATTPQGAARFIAIKAAILEGDVPTAEFDKLWRQSCH